MVLYGYGLYGFLATSVRILLDHGAPAPYAGAYASLVTGESSWRT